MQTNVICSKGRMWRRLWLLHLIQLIHYAKGLLSKGELGKVCMARSRVAHGGPEGYQSDVSRMFKEEVDCWFFDPRRADGGVLPEKGSNPRIIRISMKLARMLKSLPRNGGSQRVWRYKDTFYLDKQFRRQRKRVARKLGNPRILQIHFHTLRHWKATMLYHETKDILYVMQFLGHKNIKNTLRYIQLDHALFRHLAEEFVCKVAATLKEATQLIEAAFEYVTEMDGSKLFRKRKTSLVGSSTVQEGSSASLV